MVGEGVIGAAVRAIAMSGAERRNRMREWLARLAIALFGVAMALGFLEVAVRLLIDQEAATVERDPVIGHHYHPSRDEEVFSPTANRRIHRTFNRLGFRGPDRETEKPPGVRRVAVLGDSFIASTGLDDADTLPFALERRLNELAPQARWEVLGFGVDAFSPAQSLITWRTYARPFDLDVVVFAFFNGNDVSDGDRRLTNYPRPYYSIGANGELVLSPPPALSGSMSRWLGEHSRFYMWQKRAVQQFINRFRGLQERPPFLLYLDPQPPPEAEGSWRIAERVVAAMADEVRAAGSGFLLVSIPDFLQVRDADWREALSRADPAFAARLQRDYPEQRLAAVAARGGFPFLPLREPLRAGEAKREVYLPDAHWNGVGVGIAADLIAPVVVDLGARSHER